MECLPDCGVYRIVSPSGRFYIGSSKTMGKRWGGHRASLRRGDHHCSALQHAANKYGVNNLRFERLVVNCQVDAARSIEQRLILGLKPEYNSTDNVREALSGLWRKPEFRDANIKASSDRMKAMRLEPGFVRQQCESAAAALSALHRNPVFAAEHKIRATERLQRIVNTPEVKAKATAGRITRIAADRQNPEAWSKRFAKAALRRKRVLCVETGQVFASTKLAADWVKTLGFTSTSQVSRCCGGHAKTAYGYTWQYLDG